jgi:hypothetical protein
MRDLNYTGLSEKLAERAKKERRRSHLESLDWLDNLDALSQSIADRGETVKLQFGLTGAPTSRPIRYLTTDGKSKKWCYESEQYTDE